MLVDIAVPSAHLQQSFGLGRALAIYRGYYDNTIPVTTKKPHPCPIQQLGVEPHFLALHIPESNVLPGEIVKSHCPLIQ